MENTSWNFKKEILTNRRTSFSPHFLWGAEFFYVCDGDGNIVRSIDITSKKEYNYEYEEGRIVRATEADIELSGEIVTSKVIVNTVKYYYDTEGKMTKKVITPASGSAQTIYYETNAWVWNGISKLLF